MASLLSNPSPFGDGAVGSVGSIGAVARERVRDPASGRTEGEFGRLLVLAAPCGAPFGGLKLNPAGLSESRGICGIRIFLPLAVVIILYRLSAALLDLTAGVGLGAGAGADGGPVTPPKGTWLRLAPMQAGWSVLLYVRYV